LIHIRDSKAPSNS